MTRQTIKERVLNIFSNNLEMIKKIASREVYELEIDMAAFYILHKDEIWTMIFQQAQEVGGIGKFLDSIPRSETAENVWELNSLLAYWALEHVAQELDENIIEENGDFIYDECHSKKIYLKPESNEPI